MLLHTLIAAFLGRTLRLSGHRYLHGNAAVGKLIAEGSVHVSSSIRSTCLAIVLCGVVASSALATLDQTGQWSAVDLNWPEEAIHAHVLPIGPNAGSVLFWGKGHPQPTGPIEPHIWNPVAVPPTDPFTSVPDPGYNAFCSGHAFLPDGKLLVTGGHLGNYQGLINASKYDPEPPPTGDWAAVDDMNNPRWYPTTTALWTGEMLVIGGQNNGIGAGNQNTYNNEPQVLSYNGTIWRSLSGAVRFVPYYPYMFAAPNGKVFMAGPEPNTRYLDTTEPGTWDQQLDNLSTTRRWGSAVMYEPGKILVMGGTSCGWYATTSQCLTPPVNTAEKIDLNAQSPAWTPVADMPTGGRKLHNATLLADGTVLVTGGCRGTNAPNSQLNRITAAWECELWDPRDGSWSIKPNIPFFRGYHSTALLLPDGRVLSAGGDYAAAQLPTGNWVQDPTSAEIYSPPYLFNGDQLAARPSIGTLSTNIMNYNGQFTVATSDGSNITAVTLLGIGSVTHGFNMGQRFLKLNIVSRTSSSVTVTTPASANDAPPGYYMIFIFKNNVPSKAKFVQFNTPPA